MVLLVLCITFFVLDGLYGFTSSAIFTILALIFILSYVKKPIKEAGKIKKLPEYYAKIDNDNNLIINNIGEEQCINIQEILFINYVLNDNYFWNKDNYHNRGSKEVLYCTMASNGILIDKKARKDIDDIIIIILQKECIVIKEVINIIEEVNSFKQVLKENKVELLSEIFTNELSKLENIDHFKNYDEWLKNLVNKYENENIPLKEDIILFLITMYKEISKSSIGTMIDYINESGVAALKEIKAESYVNLFESSKDKLKEILKGKNQILKDSSEKIGKIIIEFVIELAQLVERDSLFENYLIKYIEDLD